MSGLMFEKPKKAEKKSPKPLKRTAIVRKTPLKRSQKPIKRTSMIIKTDDVLKTKKPKKRRQKTYKPVCKYWSILTANLDRCYISGSTKPEADIHIHHIFGASNKHNSEIRGFIVPLRADWHDMADYGVHNKNKELDLRLKRACQDYYLENYGTKEEFIAEFGKWW